MYQNAYININIFTKEETQVDDICYILKNLVLRIFPHHIECTSCEDRDVNNMDIITI